jgi:dipeptidyl aminopeptidase/acylaminoacyl peptidase
MSKQIRQYGLWSSPINARGLKGDLRLLDVQWDSDGETLVWLEGRTKQSVLVMQRGFDAPRDLTVDLSVRGGVGYGGGEFTVRGGVVIFAASDGRLYRQSLEGGSARAITPAFGKVAAPALSADGRWVAYVHTDADVDGLALVDSQGELWPRKLAFGTDFVMQPTWHPSGEYLAYVSWNHPQMPWDATELKVIRLGVDAAGTPYPTETHLIASGASIIQPEFSPDGKTLAYLSDASGWWQLYLYDLSAGTHRQLTHTEAEHGIPAWVQGMRTYGWCHDSRGLYNLRHDVDAARLVRIDVRDGREQPFETLDEYTELRQIAVSPRYDGVAMLAASGLVTERVSSFVTHGFARYGCAGRAGAGAAYSPPFQCRISHPRAAFQTTASGVGR